MKEIPWLVSKKDYQLESKFSDRTITSELNNVRSTTGVVNMSTPFEKQLILSLGLSRHAQ